MNPLRGIRTPLDGTQTLDRQAERNARILERLLKLQGKSVLVIACDLEHAQTLAIALREERRRAEVIHADTPRNERLAIIERFKKKEIDFLCNVNVLTTGFDAPKVDVVCITQPTMSSLRYEQMVGRGLRGPKNGGTKSCLVIDVQSTGLPKQVLSYERVVRKWATQPSSKVRKAGGSRQ